MPNWVLVLGVGHTLFTDEAAITGQAAPDLEGEVAAGA